MPVPPLDAHAHAYVLRERGAAELDGWGTLLALLDAHVSQPAARPGRAEGWLALLVEPLPLELPDVPAEDLPAVLAGETAAVTVLLG